MAILPARLNVAFDRFLCCLGLVGVLAFEIVMANTTITDNVPIETEKLCEVHTYTHEELSKLYSCHEQLKNETTLQFTQEEALMLMRLAKHEAGCSYTEDITIDNVDAKSQALIMLVVINRVKSDNFPNTIKEVLYQTNPIQFSIFIDGSIMNTEPDLNSHLALALIESGWDESQGATYFDAEWGGDTWQSRNCELLYIDQGTRFYK